MPTCFVTGEISEQTVHLARETGMAFISAGHHATERYGVMALGESRSAQFGIDCEFVDIDNPSRALREGRRCLPCRRKLTGNSRVWRANPAAAPCGARRRARPGRAGHDPELRAISADANWPASVNVSSRIHFAFQTLGDRVRRIVEVLLRAACARRRDSPFKRWGSAGGAWRRAPAKRFGAGFSAMGSVASSNGSRRASMRGWRRRGFQPERREDRGGMQAGSTAGQGTVRRFRACAAMPLLFPGRRWVGGDARNSFVPGWTYTSRREKSCFRLGCIGRCGLKVCGLLRMLALVGPVHACRIPTPRFSIAIEQGDISQAREWLDNGLPPDFEGQ
jgi:hypothetical protein